MSEQKKGDDGIGYLFNTNVLSEVKAKAWWLQMYKVYTLYTFNLFPTVTVSFGQCPQSFSNPVFSFPNLT